MPTETNLENIDTTLEAGKITDVKSEKPAELQHSIETYFVGLPGAEKLVADTATGDQVGVRRLETSDVISLKKTVIEQKESDSIEALAGKPIEDQSQTAQETMDATRNEADDMVKIAELLESKKDVILTVDTDSITDTRIPKGNALHLLIKNSEIEPIKKLLADSDYYLEEMDDEIGLKATKGSSEMVFMYAKESK